MADLADGESVEIQGSAKLPYVITNTGGVYACTCPAWRNQSLAIEKRTCKHIRKIRGDAAETERVGNALPAKKASKSSPEGPPILLAHSWDNDADLTDWWMSEKLDGVRAYWDGKQFLSRQGNTFHAPDWFIEHLPDTPLDGELWLDRKAFQRTVSIVRRQDKSEHWQEIRYLVFDAPSLKDPFEERLAFVKDTLASIGQKHLEAVAQERCQGTSHLQEELARIESLGGEGLMLREPASAYEAGRSTSLLKVKSFTDAEATVMDYEKGKGRHKGRTGALVVQLADGTQFKVGTGLSDKQRENPPAVGSVITFRYQEMTDGGVPRFPSFLREFAGPVSGSQSGKQVTSKKSTATKPVVATPSASATKKAAKKSAAGADTNDAEHVDLSEARHFEYSDEKSSKFWEIAYYDTRVTVRYGKLGANGQTKTKTFPEAAKATAYAEKLIEEKTGKGYEET